MSRLSAAGRVASQLIAYSASHRQWWLLAVMLLLGLAAVLVSAGHAAAPYTLYTLF
jgi:hypothetical protein